jgi:hypothetical protein
MKTTMTRISARAAIVAIAVVCAVIGSHRFVAGATSGDAAEEAMATIRPEAIRADMRFLADDLLEGRGTGARGHELAAKFVAAQFEQMALEPAGDGGTYFQRVPLRDFRADEESTTVILSKPGKEWKLVNRKDYLVHGSPLRRRCATAERRIETSSPHASEEAQASRFRACREASHRIRGRRTRIPPERQFECGPCVRLVGSSTF